MNNQSDTILSAALKQAKEDSLFPYCPIEKRTVYFVKQGPSRLKTNYSLRTHFVAKKLVQCGYDVCCFIKPLTATDFSRRGELDSVEEHVDGVRYLYSLNKSNFSVLNDVDSLRLEVDIYTEWLCIYRPSRIVVTDDTDVSLPVWIAAKKLKIPIFFEVRNIFGSHYHQDMVANFDSVIKFISKRVNKIFALNHDVKSSLLNIGAEEEKISIFPNGWRSFRTTPNCKIFILGSCVSRDPISVMLGKSVDLVDYFARTSLAVLTTPPVENDNVLQKISSPFQRRMVENDLNKTIVHKIVNSEFDILLIDLIDERFNLLNVAGNLLTFSSEYSDAHGTAKLGETIEAFTDEKRELWCRGANHLSHAIESSIGFEKVVLNKVYWTKTINGGGHLEGVSDRDISKVNEDLDFMYDYLARIMPGMHYIEYEPSLLQIDPNHKWGVTPYHYYEGYESQFRYELSKIIDKQLFVPTEPLVENHATNVEINGYFFPILESINDDIKKINEKASLGDLDEPSSFLLSSEVTWRSFSLNKKSDFTLYLDIDTENSNPKSGVLLVEIFDISDRKINPNEINLPKSELFGSNFVYLPESSAKRVLVLKLCTNVKVKSLKLGFVSLNKAAKIRISNLDCVPIEKTMVPVLNDHKVRKQVVRANHLKVALIADEFTLNSFKDEFIALPLTPSNWESIFEKEKPDVFFCESAWSGHDSENRPWKGQIYSSKNFKNENRENLLAILARCKEEGIPTVFWNKEDPTHHSDLVHNFVDTAKQFQFVFTTAEECVDSYRNTHGIKSVFPLPFATNPRLFNPIETGERTNDVTFAGSWYENHTKRCQVMESMLDEILDEGFNLKLFDRFYGSDDQLHRWPERYKKYLLPAKPHDEMPDVYKSSHISLNFNTVTESATMFARRVFELMSCNTLVLSNYSVGIEKMFNDLVIFPDKGDCEISKLAEKDLKRIRHQALHEVLSKHTYRNRWQYILDKIGYICEENIETLTFTFVINSRIDALNAISWYQREGVKYLNSQLLLVVNNDVSPLEISKFYKEFNKYGVTVTSLHYIKKYKLNYLSSFIETSHFVALSHTNFVDIKRLEEAVLHLQYMKDNLILLSDLSTYTYESINKPIIENILGGAKLFGEWIENVLTGSSVTVYRV